MRGRHLAKISCCRIEEAYVVVCNPPSTRMPVKGMAAVFPIVSSVSRDATKGTVGQREAGVMAEPRVDGRIHGAESTYAVPGSRCW
jgi:hypothetical protein